MNLLIDPKIIIQKPIKNKKIGYQVCLDKKDRTKLLIKSFNAKRNIATVGSINREGCIDATKEVLILLTSKEVKKINFLLDVIFGVKRDKFEFIVKNGYVVFHK